MLEIILSLIIGTGLGRIGDVLIKERSRKKRLNELVVKTAKRKGGRRKISQPSQIEPPRGRPLGVDDNTTLSTTTLTPPSPLEGEGDMKVQKLMTKDEIKAKIVQFFEKYHHMSNMFVRVAKGINAGEAETKAVLNELVAEGRLQCTSGFYKLRTSEKPEFLEQLQYKQVGDKVH